MRSRLRESPFSCFVVLGALLTTFFVSVFLHFPGYWTDVLVSFSPSLAGVLSAYLVRGTQGIRTLAKECVAWRVRPIWYVAVLVVPLVAYLTHAARQDSLGAMGQSLAWLIVAFAMKVFLGGGLGEELGWRGFALPELRRNYNFAQSNLLVGVCWGIWHFPAVYFFGKPPVMYFIYVALCVVLSFLFGWVYEKTNRSVFVCILLHAGLNTPNQFAKLVEAYPT